MQQDIRSILNPEGDTVRIIKITDVVIGADRQRKDFDAIALADLSESAKAKGLMHAIVLRDTSAGKTLVAGERRMRSIENLSVLGESYKFNNVEIPDGYIPFVTLGELSSLDAEEAELEENLHRKDLTWQENAAAMAKLHSLRSRQAQAEGRLHTIADTATEVKGRGDGSYQNAVRKDIIVSKYLDNPEVQKAKSAEEAFKIIKRQEETAKNVTLAATVGKTYSAAIHELHNTNCLEWMARPESAGLFDVILTDPPYGMGADSFGDGGGGRLANNEHHYKDDLATWRPLMQEWARLSFIVAKAQCHAYVFCDIDNFHELKEFMQKAGWYVTRTPFIANKPNSGRVPHPTEGPRRQWEMILYAIKGHKNTTAIYPDVITTMADSGLSHGAQKPVALYTNLLQRSVRPGDVILDSFTGSGTIFPAAQQYKCKAVGLEMSPEYYAISYKRLQELTMVQSGDGNTLASELKDLMALGIME